MVSAVSGSTAALQGQIQRDQLDLNDWVTCVSAKTPKGKEEIQKISGELSAAKQQLTRVQATKPSSPTLASNAVAAAAATPSHSKTSLMHGQGGLIDVWV